jgi:hypothetical protein
MLFLMVKVNISYYKKVSYQLIKWKLNQSSIHQLCHLCHLVNLVAIQFQIHHLLPKKTCLGSNINILKMVDFTYFHLIMKYGIIFWSSSTDSKWVFQQQKRTERIMTRSMCISSWKPTYEALEILAVPAQFRPVIPLLAFIAHDLEHSTLNFSVNGTARNKL